MFALPLCAIKSHLFVFCLFLTAIALVESENVCLLCLFVNVVFVFLRGGGFGTYCSPK
jgi:hypothetical protein